MGWGTYVNDRVERLEYHLRRLPVSDRTHTEYVLAWAALRDARVLAQLPKISPDLRPPDLSESQLPHEATLKLNQPWWASNWWTGNRAAKAYAALHRADAAYLSLAPPAIVRQLAADLLTQLATCGLPTTDPRYSVYQATLKGVASPAPAKSEEKGHAAETPASSSATHTKASGAAGPVAPPPAPPTPSGTAAASGTSTSPSPSTSLTGC